MIYMIRWLEKDTSSVIGNFSMILWKSAIITWGEKVYTLQNEEGLNPDGQCHQIFKSQVITNPFFNFTFCLQLKTNVHCLHYRLNQIKERETSIALQNSYHYPKRATAAQLLSMSSISLYKWKHFLKEAYYPSGGTLKTFDNQRKT